MKYLVKIRYTDRNKIKFKGAFRKGVIKGPGSARELRQKWLTKRLNVKGSVKYF